MLPDFGPYFTDRYRTPWGRPSTSTAPARTRCGATSSATPLQWFEDFHVDGLRLDAVHEIVDRTARPFLAELAGDRRRSSRETIRAAALADRRERRQRPAGGHADAAAADSGWTPSGTTTSTTPCTSLLTGERDGYYADFGRSRPTSPGPWTRASSTRASTRGFRAPPSRSPVGWGSSRAGSWSSPRTTTRSATGPTASGWPSWSTRPRSRLAAAVSPALARHAAALHGRGVRRDRAVPLLRRPRRSRLVDAVRRGRAAEFGRRRGRRRSIPPTPRTFDRCRLDRSTSRHHG